MSDDLFEGNHGTFTIDSDQIDTFLEIKESNDSGFGVAIVVLAEDWMAEMERRIRGGEHDINDFLDDAERAVDQGYTGFMYGMAAKIVSRCWVYGEQFHKAYNHQNIHDPERAEEANQQPGAIVNPAILTTE